MEKTPFVLSEADNLCAVREPLRRSSRVKYSCFTASQNYLIFGASSGGLYIFHREPCSFIQLLPSTNGSVTHVSISPCESLVAVTTVKGSVSIIGFQSTSAPRFKRTSYEHEGSIISALQWSARSTELYVGDATGRVSVLSLLFYMLSHVQLMQLDSRIVQMDWHYHLLLVSTFSRSYLCDTIHQQYRQIGSQLRDGPYGACFHNVGDEDLSAADMDRETTRSSTQFSSLREGERLMADDRLRSVKIYCARPGLRLWEVRVDGTVLNTLQLKRALAVPAVSVINLSTAATTAPAEVNGGSNATPQQPFNFSKLCRAVDDKFLLAFHSGGFYLLDPGVNGVVIWSDSIKGIVEVKTVREMVYLWCNNGTLRAVNVCELDSLVVRLYIQSRYDACASLVTNYKDYFTTVLKESPKFQFLPDLAKKIKENSIVVTNEVMSALESLTHDMFSLQEKQTALKLDSGIFLVGNDFSLNYNVSQPKSQTYSYRDALLRKKADFNRRNGCDISLKVESDTRASSRDSSDVESTADDLDDVFQLLGITKQEMKIALKEMGNTITGTLTNSTKSVKHSLRVMMSKQKLPWASNYRPTTTPGAEDDGDLSISSDGRRKSFQEWRKSPNTRINDFIQTCENVSNYKPSDEKRQEDCIFDFLESLVHLSYQYGALTSDELTGIVLGRRNEPDLKTVDVSDIFSEWLQKDQSSIFVFSQIFSEDIVVQVRIHLHNSLKSGMLVSWIKKNLPDIQESSWLFPSFMRTLYNEVDFLVDRILSHFLKTAASLLDPFIILHCLSVSQSSCIFLSWNRVLELCQEGKLHRDRNSFEGVKKSEWPLPITLNAILIMLDLKQVEYCKSAPIKDIFYTILRLETRGLRNGKSESAVFEECGSLFMEYLGGLFSSEITDSLDDIEIRTYLLIHFEQMQCFQNEFECCPCGLPQPFSNVELGMLKLRHSKVCRSIVMWLNQNDKDRLSDLCRTNSLLWPLILSVRRNESLETLLPTIIQMGDFFELEYRLDEMTENLWSKVFLLCSDLGQNSCLGCSKPLKIPLKSVDETVGCDRWTQFWKRLAEFLIRKVGPAEGTRLLGNHANMIPRGVTDESFLKLCAVSTLIDPTSSDLSKYVLDSILNVSRRIPNVSAFSRKVVENFDKSDIATDMLPSLSRNHHWGVKMNLEGATCPCCLLPLGSSVLVQQGGIAVFKCAHVFHTVCLKKQTSTLKKSGCPVCPPKSAVN